MEDPRRSQLNHARWDIDRLRYHMEQPPAPRREIRCIDSILKDVVAGLEQPIDDRLLLLRQSWEKMVGSQIAQHSSPGVLENFILTVHVDHPGWISELERLKRVLLQKLQSQYAELRIRRLAFRLIHRA